MGLGRASRAVLSGVRFPACTYFLFRILVCFVGRRPIGTLFKCFFEFRSVVPCKWVSFKGLSGRFVPGDRCRPTITGAPGTLKCTKTITLDAASEIPNRKKFTGILGSFRARFVKKTQIQAAIQEISFNSLLKRPNAAVWRCREKRLK